MAPVVELVRFTVRPGQRRVRRAVRRRPLQLHLGMLLCLSRPLRLAYLLGDLMGMTDVEGAAICDTTPAAYRQRLARARATMRGVIADRCGWSAPPTRAGAASSSPAASTTAPGGCGR